MNPNKIVIYSVLPRLWGNKTQDLKVGGTLRENGSGKLSDFTPEALSYIRSLGATHVWYIGLLEHQDRLQRLWHPARSPRYGQGAGWLALCREGLLRCLPRPSG